MSQKHQITFKPKRLGLSHRIDKLQRHHWYQKLGKDKEQESYDFFQQFYVGRKLHTHTKLYRKLCQYILKHNAFPQAQSICSFGTRCQFGDLECLYSHKHRENKTELDNSAITIYIRSDSFLLLQNKARFMSCQWHINYGGKSTFMCAVEEVNTNQCLCAIVVSNAVCIPSSVARLSQHLVQRLLVVDMQLNNDQISPLSRISCWIICFRKQSICQELHNIPTNVILISCFDDLDQSKLHSLFVNIAQVHIQNFRPSCIIMSFDSINWRTRYGLYSWVVWYMSQLKCPIFISIQEQQDHPPFELYRYIVCGLSYKSDARNQTSPTTADPLHIIGRNNSELFKLNIGSLVSRLWLDSFGYKHLISQYLQSQAKIHWCNNSNELITYLTKLRSANAETERRLCQQLKPMTEISIENLVTKKHISFRVVKHIKGDVFELQDCVQLVYHTMSMSKIPFSIAPK